MKRLIILDYSTGETDIYPTEYDNEPDMEELLDNLGHRAYDCIWLFSEGKITFHNEVLK